MNTLSQFKFVQMKGHALFQGQMITKYWKHIDEILIVFSSVFSGERSGPWASCSLSLKKVVVYLYCYFCPDIVNFVIDR